MNKGFAFFSFYDPKCADMAIKHLNGFEIGSNKLVVQKSEMSKKQTSQSQISFIQNDYPKWLIPIFAMSPSRVVQILNLIQPEDIVEHEDHHEAEKMVLKLAMEFGEVYSIEIPKPDGVTGVCTVGTGKAFVKFRSLISAKKF